MCSESSSDAHPLPSTLKHVEDVAQTELSWRVKDSGYPPLKSTAIIRYIHLNFNIEVESNCVHGVEDGEEIQLWYQIYWFNLQVNCWNKF